MPACTSAVKSGSIFRDTICDAAISDDMVAAAFCSSDCSNSKVCIKEPTINSFIHGVTHAIARLVSLADTR